MAEEAKKKTSEPKIAVGSVCVYHHPNGYDVPAVVAGGNSKEGFHIIVLGAPDNFEVSGVKQGKHAGCLE